MSADQDSTVKAPRRHASFLQRAEDTREFSNGKLVILAAVLIAAISGAITLLVLR